MHFPLEMSSSELIFPHLSGISPLAHGPPLRPSYTPGWAWTTWSCTLGPSWLDLVSQAYGMMADTKWSHIDSAVKLPSSIMCVERQRNLVHEKRHKWNKVMWGSESCRLGMTMPFDVLPILDSSLWWEWSPTFLAPRTDLIEDNFSTDWGWGGWFRDDYSILHILCTLFLI